MSMSNRTDFPKMRMVFSKTDTVIIVSYVRIILYIGSNMIIVPYLLSMWAVYKQRLPAPLLFVDGRAEDKYCAKAQELCDAHLATSIDSIWSSIHDVPRTLMISMWLTRSAYRSSVAHPTPTTVDGMGIIDSDLRLSEPEKFCAKGIIQTAKDKNNNPLFPEL